MKKESARDAKSRSTKNAEMQWVTTGKNKKKKTTQQDRQEWNRSSQRCVCLLIVRRIDPSSSLSTPLMREQSLLIVDSRGRNAYRSLPSFVNKRKTIHLPNSQPICLSKKDFFFSPCRYLSSKKMGERREGFKRSQRWWVVKNWVVYIPF